MRKCYLIPFVLIITMLLITACGSKEEKITSPEVNSRDYILSAFSIPAALKVNSNLAWTVTNDLDSKGSLQIDLVSPDIGTLNANMPVQAFLDRALAINKEAKVIIEKLLIQVKDPNLNQLVTATYAWNGTSFDISGWTAEGVTQIQGLGQNPNLAYPIEQYVPPVAPNAYP